MKTSEIYTSYMYSYPHKTAYRTLENVHFSDYKRLLTDSGGSLYFHVPFCQSKCGYCNLFSVTGQNESYMEEYVAACEAQLKQYDIPASCFDSLTVGGGDPMILPVKLLHKLLSFAAEGINLNIETSPGCATAEKLEVLKEFHADRISMGVQSFDDSELAVMRRTHRSASVRRALHLIKSMDFPCVNIDLIYGVPGQTPAAFEKNLKEALDFAPDEIFIYPLYIRSRTGLSGQVRSEDTYKTYELARDYLLANGYFQVSMRRFIKGAAPAVQSCGFETMLAVGCGGRSYLGNLHFCTPFTADQSECVRNIDSFIKKDNKIEINYGYILNDDEQKRRYVIKNLLHFTGVSSSAYKNISGNEIFRDFPELTGLIRKGYAEEYGDFIRLTPLGMSLSDYIGPMFISKTVKDKMTDWKDI